MFSNFLFSPENRAVYVIMSKIVVEPKRPQMTTLQRVAFWIIKTTRAQPHARARATIHLPPPPPHTHTQKYVIIFAFPLQEWFRERAEMLRYAYIA